MFFLHFAHFPKNRVMFSCLICEDTYATSASVRVSTRESTECIFIGFIGSTSSYYTSRLDFLVPNVYSDLCYIYASAAERAKSLCFRVFRPCVYSFVRSSICPFVLVIAII